MNESSLNDKIQLAVFDFDGTIIDGNSPVILVRYLVRKHMLHFSVFWKIVGWGLAYSLHLPQNEAWVRGQVFSAFQGMAVEEVDSLLKKFYDIYLDSLLKPQAVAEIKEHHRLGHIVVAVSATFEPILSRMQQRHHYFDKVFATKMKKTSQGTYLCEVDGLPIEGKEKLSVVEQFGNDNFGVDGWELSYVYADHHSDRVILSAAAHPFAVDPGPYLRKLAKERNWPILDWD